MIIFGGHKYRGITQFNDMFVFRYTDAQGREHRPRFSSLEDALVQYHFKKARAKRGEKLPAPSVLKRNRLRIHEIIEDALVYSKQTKRSYRTDVPRFERLDKLFGNRQAEMLTPKEIEDTLNRVSKEENWAASTFNHYRSLISLAYRLGMKDRGLTINPARSVPHRREDNSHARFLSQKEEERLRGVIKSKYSWHLPELDLALQTGLRQGNQFALTWTMVDWSARMLHIPRTKNEESLHVPLNEGALAALKIVLGRSDGTGRIFRSERTGEPLEHPRHWFEPALNEAGVEGFHWHDLRHTFASRLRMKGTPLEDIADLLGHKSLAMTKRYAHLGPTRLHEVVARLMEKHSESGTESGTGEIVPVNDDVVSFVN